MLASHMKTNLHPTYHPDAKITCACGNELTTGSTREAISIELCSNCHPFYTGEQKIVDTARRVEKFETKTTKKSDAVFGAKAKAEKKAARAKKRADKEAKAEK